MQRRKGMKGGKNKDQHGKRETPIEDLEQLSYYDLFAYLNMPFFNLGGRASIDQLAEMCHITRESYVLEVGCGTGGNACYLAEKVGCTVTGIDASEPMVEQARARADAEGLTGKVAFEVGNANHLRFEDATFDTVITVFVTQFLDIQLVFPQFARVLKQGGVLGVNEMYKMDNIPTAPAQKLLEGEALLCEITQLPFKLYTQSDWRNALERTDLGNIRSETIKILREKGVFKQMVKDMGGYRKVFGMIGKVIKLAWKSKSIRQKFGTLGQAKKILLRQKATKQYLGYTIAAGQKI